MKYRIDIEEGVVALPRIVRLLVVIFCPWLALWVARKQLWIACLIIRNEARCKHPEDSKLIRWAEECERDGQMECPPNTPISGGIPSAASDCSKQISHPVE
jgi:hypothetical protein